MLHTKEIILINSVDEKFSSRNFYHMRGIKIFFFWNYEYHCERRRKEEDTKVHELTFQNFVLKCLEIDNKSKQRSFFHHFFHQLFTKRHIHLISADRRYCLLIWSYRQFARWISRWNRQYPFFSRLGKYYSARTWKDFCCHRVTVSFDCLEIMLRQPNIVSL